MWRGGVVDQVQCMGNVKAVIESDVGSGGGCHAGEIDELISASTNIVTELLRVRQTKSSLIQEDQKGIGKMRRSILWNQLLK